MAEHSVLGGGEGNLVRSAVANQRAPVVRKGGPGSYCVAYVFFVFLGSIIICRLSKLTLSYKAQVTVQLRASLSDLE